MKFVNLLIKPASSLCNMRCKYCFYEDEAQNRSQYSMGVMKEDLAEMLIRQTFEAVDPDGCVSFAFQGGEPTVAGLAFFQNFVKEAKRRKPPGVSIRYAIQTNGTLLDEAWAKFLKEERFLVGISLDGFRSAHDTYRVDSLGQGTWQRAVAGKNLLEKYAVEYNALCVVTGKCAENPEKVYGSLKNLGFRYMQFIACLDPIGKKRGQEPWSLTPDAYGKFLCRMFDLWYQDWKTGDYRSVRLFEDYVHILLGDNASTCATCGKCGVYLVVEADGSVYPCDFFALDDWCMGNIRHSTLAEISRNQKAVDFRALETGKPAECRSCPYGQICNGGCKNDWFADADGSHNYYCDSFKQLLEYALPRIQQIARLERMAREPRRY